MVKRPSKGVIRDAMIFFCVTVVQIKKNAINKWAVAYNLGFRKVCEADLDIHVVLNDR